jgi:molybdopterin-guanine dinucleotide biosynthesis protein A
VSSTIVVLAGSDAGDAAAVGGVSKALLRVGGVTSLERVLAAIEQSSAFERIVVVGPEELEGALAGTEFTKPVILVRQGESLIDNIRRAFSRAGVDRLFFVTADVPLITPAELDRFAELAESSAADAAIALARPSMSVAYGALVARYRRSMIIAQGGPYMLANLFALRGTVLEFAEIVQLARNVRQQSSVANMTRAFGALASLGLGASTTLVTWLRLVLARALWLLRGEDAEPPGVAPTVDQMERAVVALTRRQLSVRFVDIGAEGACFDVDDTEQYELINRAVASVHGRE